MSLNGLSLILSDIASKHLLSSATSTIVIFLSLLSFLNFFILSDSLLSYDFSWNVLALFSAQLLLKFFSSSSSFSTLLKSYWYSDTVLGFYLISTSLFNFSSFLNIPLLGHIKKKKPNYHNV